MAAKLLSRIKSGPAALLLLSFLLALGAMRADLFPAVNSAPPLEREAVPFALLALLAALFAIARKSPWPRRPHSSIVIGLGLFVAPALLVSLSQDGASAFTRVALFSLVPVFTVVFEPYLGAEAGSQIRGSLLAALVAVVGTLCVFPIALPGSLVAAASFAAVIVAAICVAVANCYAVRAATSSPSNTIAPITAIASASAAVGLLAASACNGSFVLRWNAFGSDLAWAALISLPALILLFWLMPRMTAVRMATRFVLAPLIAILISMGIDRPSVGLRIRAGLLLVAAGAGWLLFAPISSPDANSSMLNLNRS